MNNRPAKKTTSYKWRKFVNIVVPILIVAFLLWLLQRIGWDRIGQVCVTIGWSGLALLLPFGFLENLLDSLAFHSALLKRTSFRRVLACNCQGAIINMVIPGEIGEIYKSSRIKQYSNWGDSITGTVIWNYLLKLSNPASRLTAVLLAFILGHGIEPWLAYIVASAVILSFTPYFLLKLFVRQGMAVIVVRILSFIRIVRKNPEEFHKSAKDLDNRIRDFKKDHARQYWEVLSYQYLARIPTFTALFIAIRLVGLDYPLGLVAMIFAGSGVATYVLSILPARFGVSEGVGYFIFSLFGLNAPMGLIIFIILRIKGILAMGFYSLLNIG